MNCVTILEGHVLDKLRELPDNSVHCVVTSPPYFGLRDYQCEGQIGLEKTLEEYIAVMVEVFREVRRVMRPDASLWLNLGDTYAASRSYQVPDNKHPACGEHDKGSHKVPPGLKPKDLCGVPWRVALALQADGWWLRSDIIWAKGNPMPSSVTDRPSTSHEYIFLLTKSARYYWDAEAVREKCQSGPSDIKKMEESKERIGGFYKDAVDPLMAASSKTNIGHKRAVGSPSGRNCRSVWHINTQPFSDWTETSRQVPVELGEVSDGMKHIVSQDCPVHGCLYRQDSNSPDGEREGDSQTHSGRNGNCLAQAPLFDCAPIDPIGAGGLSLPNLDSPAQPCSPSAKDHNTGTRRKAPVPETTTPCISSAEIPCHTADRLAEPESGACHPGTSCCTPLPGETGAHSPAQTLCRTVDKSSLPIPPECICKFYQEITEKSSHFATFPPALVEKCIKAGCPEDGTVLDPFNGAGTTCLVAAKLGRDSIGIELKPEYVEIAKKRIRKELGFLVEIIANKNNT